MLACHGLLLLRVVGATYKSHTELLGAKDTKQIAGHLVRGNCHLPSVAEGRAQVFKVLHILKSNATVAKYRWVEAKEGHGFCLVHIQRQPF